MADQSNTPSNSSPYLLGSLTDPVSTFQHNLETQRNAALAHETLLKFQLATLQTDLEATQRMIIGCDAALMALSSGTIPGAGDTSSDTKQESNTSGNDTPPVAPPAPNEGGPIIAIPPFLAKDSSAA